MGRRALRAQARQKRAAAAEKYRPEKIDLLIVAEAPPAAEDRYFYFEHVPAHDVLFREVAQLILARVPTRSNKPDLLAALRARGVFLIDLKRDAVDGSPLGDYVPDLIARCKALEPTRIALIKATVYEAAFGPLARAGLPVIDQRIYFPSSGRQRDFRRQFAAALRIDSPPTRKAVRPARGTERASRLPHRRTFSPREADQIRGFLNDVRKADRSHQNLLRSQLRNLGFYISDFRRGKGGFTQGDFGALVSRGTITIE